MQRSRIHKSALQPLAADRALANEAASMRVLDVAVDPAEYPQHPNPHLKIAVILETGALDVTWQSANGRAMRGRVRKGSSSVMPADMPYSTCWQGAGRMLLLSFSTTFLHARDSAIGAAASELRPAWSQFDPFLVQMGLSVIAAQSAQLASTAYLDAAAEVLMVHLLHRYGLAPVPRLDLLVPSQLIKVLDLIESHIDEDLSLARLAAVAGLPVHGFARCFAKAVGEPPHRYILKRRCARARELLMRTMMPIVEIATVLGFSSQAHLTTALLHATGITPARYRTPPR